MPEYIGALAFLFMIGSVLIRIGVLTKARAP